MARFITGDEIDEIAGAMEHTFIKERPIPESAGGEISGRNAKTSKTKMGKSTVDDAVLFLARFMAVLGGIVLSALVILTCVSVVGRGLNSILHSGAIQGSMPGLAETLLATGIGPVQGDYELVEAGIAFAIFAFMPLCQITAGHASVDIFTSRLPVRVNRFIQMIVELIFGVVLIVIAQRLYAGMMSKMSYNETTFLLQFPIWWAYALSLSAALLAAIVGIYMAVVRIVEFFTMRTIVAAAEVDH